VKARLDLRLGVTLCAIPTSMCWSRSGTPSILGKKLVASVRFRGDLCLRHDVVITCVYVSADEVQTADNLLMRNIPAEGVAL